MNVQQLMKQAQKMQEQMQKQMDSTVIEATAGGGMVSVKMNGNKHLLSVQIDPEVFASGDKDMLQDLIVAAVNEATRKVDENLSSQMSGLTGGLKIPGLF
jgi:DNA-binding YbaB/EbfC family protein